jgi:hypothetical protein
LVSGFKPAACHAAKGPVRSTEETNEHPPAMHNTLDFYDHLFWRQIVNVARPYIKALRAGQTSNSPLEPFFDAQYSKMPRTL